MSGEFEELALAIAVVAVGAVLVIALVLAVIIIPINMKSCAVSGEKYERATEWNVYTGCMIESGGRMIDIEKYIAVTSD